MYCVHPGVVATDLWRHTDKRWYGKLMTPVQKMAFKTPIQGAQTTLYCCLEVIKLARYFKDSLFFLFSVLKLQLNVEVLACCFLWLAPVLDSHKILAFHFISL